MKMSVPENPPPPGIPEAFRCKSRLQEFTQKASMPLPVYHTFTEEDKRVPYFRCQVWVDGICFVSENSYLNKKFAEQNAAKLALIGLREKVKNEGHLRVQEDTVFCKLIVNEYALKANMKPPTYTTNKAEASMSVFVSSLQLNGVTYVGQAGRNKKEAEQSAARAAILSILGSESSTTMCEIVKSKFKLYNELQKVKESPIVQGGGNNAPDAVNPSTEDKENEVVAVSNNTPDAANPPMEDKENEVVAVGNYAPDAVNPPTEDKENEVFAMMGPSPTEIPQPSSLVPFPAIVQQHVLPELNTEAPHESVHVFKKPKLLQASSSPLPSAIAPPLASPVTMVPRIEYVFPASEQAPATGKKQNRKKRKPKKKGQLQNPTPITMIPQSSAPATFSMAQ